MYLIFIIVQLESCFNLHEDSFERIRFYHFEILNPERDEFNMTRILNWRKIKYGRDVSIEYLLQ